MKDIPWKVCLRAGLTAAAVWLLCTRWEALAALLLRVLQAASPLWLGAGAAYVLNLLLVFYEGHMPPGLPLKRPLGIAASLLTLGALLAWLPAVLLPTLTDCLTQLLGALPEALGALLNHLEAAWGLTRWLEAVGFNWQEQLSRTLLPALETLGGAAAALLSGAFSASASLGMAMMFAVYLLAGKERLCRRSKRLLRLLAGEEAAGRVLHVLTVAHGSFRRYVTGQCAEAVLLGGLCYLGMRLCRFALSGPIAMLAGLSALLPVAGPPLAACIGAALLLVTRPDQVPLFLLFFLLLQQAEGSIIYPRVVGASIGLSGSWVLAAAAVGGGLMGPAGMLLGVPLVSALRQLAQEWLRAKEARSPTP